MANYSLVDFRGSTKKLAAAFPLSSYPKLHDSSVGRIHVLVVVKSLEVELAEPTLKRWVELNEVLDAHKKMKLVDGVSSTAYSALSWLAIQPVFGKYTVQSIFPRREIESEDMNALYACMKLFTKALGGTIESNESKLLFFIAPILIHVSCLVENVQILVEENVVGKRVHANGRFEFVLRCGAKRICIVEAKKDDMDQGMAHNLVGCEALADVEQLDTVYGIVTNYKEWIFFKRENEQILRGHTTIRLLHTELPTLESLQDIAETIHAMLVNN
ncbi:Aste57867_17720 [Aphanomyces stellatus]|uniref:Aste57867_17720 protein n=1 Tax=Aphanomyces stellatus TaxID=120398 RepID=A0A485L974_9STRA|nr:hypothetical protein As57867_017659 [Aphanomyces stellatus]VFT94467.1 Aste57867_17720 [Aphanomyces stellatus]